MAMLAEKRKRVKYCLNPNGNLWTNDNSKFGQKMLEKMGWQEGQGLGPNNQGIKERLKVSYKFDSKGLGFKEKDGSLEQQKNFQNLLSTLNEDTNESVIDKHVVSSLEESSKRSKSRVHYKKFTRGKDISRYSSKDLNCILGSPTCSKTESDVTENNNKNFKHKGFMCDYFNSKSKRNVTSEVNSNSDIKISGSSEIVSFKNELSYENNQSTSKIKVKSDGSNVKSIHDVEGGDMAVFKEDLLENNFKTREQQKMKSKKGKNTINVTPNDHSNEFTCLQLKKQKSKHKKSSKAFIEGALDENIKDQSNQQSCQLTNDVSQENISISKRIKRKYKNEILEGNQIYYEEGCETYVCKEATHTENDGNTIIDSKRQKKKLKKGENILSIIPNDHMKESICLEVKKQKSKHRNNEDIETSAIIVHGALDENINYQSNLESSQLTNEVSHENEPNISISKRKNRKYYNEILEGTLTHSKEGSIVAVGKEDSLNVDSNFDSRKRRNSENFDNFISNDYTCLEVKKHKSKRSKNKDGKTSKVSVEGANDENIDDQSYLQHGQQINEVPSGNNTCISNIKIKQQKQKNDNLGDRVHHTEGRDVAVFKDDAIDVDSNFDSNKQKKKQRKNENILSVIPNDPTEDSVCLEVKKQNHKPSENEEIVEDATESDIKKQRKLQNSWKKNIEEQINTRCMKTNFSKKTAQRMRKTCVSMLPIAFSGSNWMSVKGYGQTSS